jgi:hypothetical protein
MHEITVFLYATWCSRHSVCRDARAQYTHRPQAIIYINTLIFQVTQFQVTQTRDAEIRQLQNAPRDPERDARRDAHREARRARRANAAARTVAAPVAPIAPDVTPVMTRRQVRHMLRRAAKNPVAVAVADTPAPDHSKDPQQ